MMRGGENEGWEAGGGGGEGLGKKKAKKRRTINLGGLKTIGKKKE